MPSQQQLFDVIRIQTQIAKQGHDLAAVMDLVTHETVQLLQVDGAAIELAEGEAMVYRAVAGLAEGQLGLRLGIDSSLSGLCVRTGVMLDCADTHSDPRVDLEACERLGLRSMLVVPLKHQDTCVGVLKAMARDPYRFGRPERTLLGLLSEAIAAAMFFATKSSQNDLFFLATHDALTDLPNRPLFIERLRTLLGSHDPKQRAIGVLRIGIEGLQVINERYGYLSGDSLIQEAAGRLQTVAGERGMVARLGGNQFTVLLTNVDDPAELETLAGAIHAAMQPPVVIGWSHLPLSLRIGAALFPQDAGLLDALLELAAMRMQANRWERLGIGSPAE